MNDIGLQEKTTLTQRVEALLSAYHAKDVSLGVIGLGYVGLPLSLAAARAGFTVIGFDVNTERVERINHGEQLIRHIDAGAMAEAINSGKFAATADFRRLREADVIMIAVPTPLSRQREPDLSFVIKSTEAIAATLRRDQLIVLESTTYPGTTREVMRPILEARGLRSGIDFFLAFSPEREDPGNQTYETSTIPKVVGGDGPEASLLARTIYSQFISKAIGVSSCDTAEAVKITENIFRAVNIALVNELKVIFDRMNINIWEVIDAAKTKPFGFMPFYPGPGLGGHCIPIDPFYLTWKAREFDVATRFIELAGQINTSMPYYVVDRLALALDQRFGRGLKGARVLVIGLAYKKNVDDIRESPSLRLIELLELRGAAVEYHDPYVPLITPTREHPDLLGRSSVPSDQFDLYDVALIATDHDCIDYADMATRFPLVIDTRNACAARGVNAANIVLA